MKPNMSNNDTLINCTKDILNNSADYNGKVLSFVEGFYLNKGVENVANYSHDEFVGAYSFVKKFSPDYMSELPLLAHFNLSTHHCRRLDNFLFFLWAKYPLLGIWFLWIPSLAMIFGALRIKRNGVIHTSGLILSFLKFNTFNMPITKWIINKRVNNYEELKGYQEVFRIYHEVNRPDVYEAFLRWEGEE